MAESYTLSDGTQVNVEDINTPQGLKKHFRIKYPDGRPSAFVYSPDAPEGQKGEPVPFDDYAVLNNYLKNR